MPGPAVTTERPEFYDHVGIIRIDRPETNNALTTDVKAELVEACRAFDTDADVNCIIIAGTDAYFAAGADLEAPAEDPVAFWTAMAAVETPMIAAVSGYALGAGFELALICDLIIASEAADFGSPEITFGLIPGGGATQRLTRLIGKHRTMELVLTGRRISGQEAYRIGIVNLATRKKEWLDRAIEAATVIARRAPVAAKLAKQAVLAADELALADGLERERELRDAAMATEDRIEGMNAFLEKRWPEFKGR